MLEIAKIKNLIESKSPIDFILVFVDTDPFLRDQYINTIIQNQNLTKHFIDSLDIFTSNNLDIFGSNIDPNYLYIYKTQSFDCVDLAILRQKHLIVICDNFANKETEDFFENNTIKIPKLLPQWVKSYAESRLPALSEQQIDWLVTTCNSNIYRIQQEIDKLTLFEAKKQKGIFDYFIKDNMFDDLSTFTIFNFTDAIITKDRKKILLILDQIHACDIEPLGVVTVLYKNFKNIINIQLGRNPTPESTGLSTKQIYAIRHRIGYYDATQLKYIFEIVTAIDRMLKTGDITVDLMIDYLLINILI